MKIRILSGCEADIAFAEALAYAYEEQTKGVHGEKQQILSQVRQCEDELKQAREWLYSKRIQPEDYAEIKKELTDELENLERRLMADPSAKVDQKGLLNKGILNLVKLRDNYWFDISRKISISENLVRTTPIE